MTTHFVNARVLTLAGFLDGATLSVEGGTILGLGRAEVAGGEIVDVGGGTLLPGFIDTQVNGGGGVLFNDAPSVETIAAIGDAHARYGTTGFLPTLISDDLDVIDKAMRAVEAAIEQNVPGVLGIHVEGPFINVARKGIHDPAKIRRLQEESVSLLSSLRRGKTLVTLAPELCSPDQIRRLVGAGVILAAGHTDADYETMRSALADGVTGFTHLFNAMSPLRHRAPGVVGAALDDEASYCGLIADGHHVDPAVLRIALRAKSPERFMLVTDAMPTVGSAEKQFRLNGITINVVDGICQDANGTLAGSDLDMVSAVRNLVAMTGATLEQAARMAATVPADFLGLAPTHGRLAVGARADIVWLDADAQVRGVWREGVALADHGEQAETPLAAGRDLRERVLH